MSEREFEMSDQRRYFVPCPHCKTMQWLQFERLRWQKGQPETAAYHCESCEQPIAEHHKTAMLEAGEWRATADTTDPSTVSYHLSALYSPVGWLSWSGIARSWEAAQGSDEAIKAFRNTILGETWVETGEAPDWQRLYDRREAWKAGADILDGPGGTVKRTLTSASPGVVYANADIIADFAAVPLVLSVTFYQISAVAGRGFARVVTLEVT